MLYDPGYSRAASSLGRSNFFGYLQDLRRVHRGIPFVVAEFGVPTAAVARIVVFATLLSPLTVAATITLLGL